MKKSATECEFSAEIGKKYKKRKKRAKYKYKKHRSADEQSPRFAWHRL